MGNSVQVLEENLFTFKANGKVNNMAYAEILSNLVVIHGEPYFKVKSININRSKY